MRTIFSLILLLLSGCADDPRARVEIETDMAVTADAQVIDQGDEQDKGVQADSDVESDALVVEPDMMPVPNCIPSAPAEAQEFCFDGRDDDCDGSIDQEDDDCNGVCDPGSDDCADNDELTEDFCSPSSWTCENPHIIHHVTLCQFSREGLCSLCEGIEQPIFHMCVVIEGVSDVWAEAWSDQDGDGAPEADPVEERLSDFVPDTCPNGWNPDQYSDIDGDNILDGCDNCVAHSNPNQENSDDHMAGDACQFLGEDNDGDCHCEGLPRIGGPPGCIYLGTSCPQLLGIADCDDSDASIYKWMLDENGERFCGSSGPILEVTWIPGTAILGRDTLHQGMIFQPWQFEIPEEVERLVGWISCWSENQAVEENRHVISHTVWQLGREIHLADHDEIPEIRMVLHIPQDEVRTISCEWNIQGLCAGQELPNPNQPIFVGGPAGWDEFCWSSISKPTEFTLMEQGQHSYRWISPPGEDIHGAYGSFQGPWLRGFVHVLNDTDRDNVPDEVDNCPDVHNSAQQDEDDDGIGDFCDVN